MGLILIVALLLLGVGLESIWGAGVAVLGVGVILLLLCVVQIIIDYLEGGDDGP